MFISLSRTYVQNFSNWHALFVLFFFFITFCSRCSMVWDTACRPTDDPFWAFLSPGAQEPAEPQTIFVHFRQLKKKFILDSHLRKIITPVPFYSKAFVLPQKFETSWALLGRLSRGFFLVLPSQGPPIKTFVRFSRTRAGLGMLMWELPGRVSYFVSSLL